MMAWRQEGNLCDICGVDSGFSRRTLGDVIDLLSRGNT